ncbi:hypothetical protein ABWH92_12285 [Ahrensia marina]|uniref:hypothetical protein n=1 Tax=Ahrensia marina TaxID=1514904 RepID=UPI0035CFCAFC
MAKALEVLAQQGESLPDLKLWITVGTPFLKFTRSRQLFARSKTLGKFLMMAVLTAYYLSVLALFDLGGVTQFDQWLDDFSYDTALTLALLAGIAVAPFAALRGVSIAWDYWAKRHTSTILRNTQMVFESRLIPLWHAEDEAIQGIGMANRSTLELFKPTFFLNLSSTLGLLLVPILLLVLIGLPITADEVDIWFGEEPPTGIFSDLFRAENWFFHLLADALPNQLRNIGIDLGGGPIWTVFYHIPIYATFLAGVGLLFLQVTRLVVAFSAPLITKAGNSVTNAAAKSQAGGADLPGLRLENVAPVPSWVAKSYAPLPKHLSIKISHIADQSASKLVSLLRTRLGLITIAGTSLLIDGDEFPLDLTTELIHTAYFECEEFRDLIIARMNDVLA